MISGKKGTAKMTWQEFQEWQRWDEFPERSNNPPMTVDIMFYYENNVYYIDSGYNKQNVFLYYLYDENWNAICSNTNFLQLLTTPTVIFHEKSFKQVIDKLDFNL